MIKSGLIPNSWIAILVVFILFLQLVAGSDVLFSLPICLAIFFGLCAMNLAGGLYTLSGLCILAMLGKSILFSQIVKVLIWQPADLNLTAPIETSCVFMVGFFAVFIAAALSRFQPEKIRFMPECDTPVILERVSIIAIAFASLAVSVLMFVERASPVGRVIFGVSTYLQSCVSLSVVTAVGATVLRSNGQRLFSPYALMGVLLGLVFGSLRSSKQIMFEPLLALGVAALAYKYKKMHRLVISSAVVIVFTLAVLFPLSQIRKNSVATMTMSQNIESLYDFYQTYLTGWDEMMAMLELTDEIMNEAYRHRHYYGFSIGLFDRFTLIDPADRLITQTKIKGFDGYGMILDTLEFLPRSITGNHDSPNIGNYLGHKSETLLRTDKITAVAVTPFAHAWSVDGWFGVLFLVSASMFLLIFSNKLVGESLVGNPWALTIFVYLQHQLAEAGIGTNFFYLIRIFPFFVIQFFVILYLARWSCLGRPGAGLLASR